MNLTLELQGSEVQWARSHGDEVRLRFSAAAVRQGQGMAIEEGHVKGLELHFDHAMGLDGDLAWCMGALSDSTLHVDGLPHRGMPLPFQATGDVRAELNFRSGATLRVSARAVHCVPPADACFHTSYAC